MLSCLDGVLEQCEACRFFPIRPRTYPWRERPLCPCSMRICRSIILLATILRLCARRRFFPNSPLRYPRDRGLPRKFGAPCVHRGLGLLATLRASRRMRVASGRMRCGRIFVRIEELNYNFKALVRTHGFLSVARVLREEFTIAPLRMAISLGYKSSQRRSAPSPT